MRSVWVQNIALALTLCHFNEAYQYLIHWCLSKVMIWDFANFSFYLAGFLINTQYTQVETYLRQSFRIHFLLDLYTTGKFPCYWMWTCDHQPSMANFSRNTSVKHLQMATISCTLMFTTMSNTALGMLLPIIIIMTHDYSHALSTKMLVGHIMSRVCLRWD